MRKRINNDFDALVEVSHEGVKIDLSLYEITSVRMVSSQAYKLTDYEVRNGSLFLHVTPLIVPRVGKYKIVVTYRMADPTLADGFWNFEFDKYLVTIVGSSEEEDAGEVVITADAVIGMQGKSAYQVWLDEGNMGTEADFFAYLQQPAADMIASLNETNEAALTAEGLRTGAESIRLQNEQGRVTAESLRATAESTRQTNTETAIQNAENATALAIEVAEHPDTIINDYWWKWNTTTNAYENTNIMAKGGVYYPVFELNPDDGLLTLTADSDFTNTTFEINETDGTLILNINM